LGGLTLPGLLAGRAAAAAGRPVKDKSVVLLFLQGGPSQIETFDPKMTGPVEFRSVTDEVKTTLPGVTIGSSFPRLARLARRLAIVRSFRTGNNDHYFGSELVASGGNSTEASMSAVYGRIAGTNHPTTGMPAPLVTRRWRWAVRC